MQIPGTEQSVFENLPESVFVCIVHAIRDGGVETFQTTSNAFVITFVVQKQLSESVINVVLTKKQRTSAVTIL